MADSKAVIEITGDASGLQSAVTKAKDSLSSLEKATKLIAGLNIADWALRAANGMKAWGERMFALVEGLDDLSEKTSLSVQFLDKLQQVATIGGHQLDSVTGSAAKLGKAFTEALGGDKDASKLFAALGVSIRDTSGHARNFDEVWAETARTLVNAENQTVANAYAQKLMGKSVAELIPFLKDFDEYGGRASRVTAEQAAAAEKAKQAFNELKLSGEQLGITLINSVVPSLTELLGNLKALQALDLKDKLLGIVGGGVVDPVKRLEEIDGLLRKLGKTRAEIEGSFANSTRMRNLPIVGTAGDLKDLDRQMAVLLAERQSLQALLGQRAQNLPELKEPPGKGKTLDPAAITQASKEAENYLKSLQNELNKTSAEGSKFLEVLRDTTGPNATVELSATQRSQAIELAKKIDAAARQKKETEWATQRLLEQEKLQYANTGEVFEDIKNQRAELVNKLTGRAADFDLGKNIGELKEALLSGEITGKEFDRARRSLSGMNDELQTYLDKLEEIDKKLKIGALTPEEATAQRIKAESDWLKQSTTTLEEATDWAKEFGLTMSSSLEDVIAKGESAHKVFQALIQDIAKMVIRQTVTKPLSDMVGKGLTALGNAAIAYFGGTGNYSNYGIGASGAGTGDLQGGSFSEYAGIQRRALGGPVAAGSLYRVNESGMEYFRPNVDGQVIPMGQAGAGGAVVVHNNFMLGVQQTVQAEIRRLTPTIARTVESSWAARRAQGGSYARA